MDRIVIDQPMFDQLAHPILGIIVEPETAAWIGERRMMKKRNIAETKLARRIDQQQAQFGQRPAGSCGFAEAVSKPTHRRRLFLRGLPTKKGKEAPRKFCAQQNDENNLRISEYN